MESKLWISKKRGDEKWRERWKGCGVSKGEYLEDLLEEKGKDGGKEARKYEKGSSMCSKEGTIAVKTRRYSIL